MIPNCLPSPEYDKIDPMRLVIELGNFSLSSVTPLGDLLWFIVGLLLLAGSTMLVLWYTRRSSTDPFA
jgi:hypothetical protein